MTEMSLQATDSPALLPRGVVMAATGADSYRLLAVEAAESFKRHNPDTPIDLLTDRPLDAPVFDRIVVSEEAWYRSKIDALQSSRFERTVYMDSDIIILADIGDVFDLLERFDIAMVQDQYRNRVEAHFTWRKDLPPTFPQFNAGFIALRNCEGTQKLLADWKVAVKEHNIGRDQPALRELLWDSDLRVGVLPYEYNLMSLGLLRGAEWRQPAPRVIHAPRFHRDYEQFRQSPDRLVHLMGLATASKIPVMLADDLALAKRAGRQLPDPRTSDPGMQNVIRKARLRWMADRFPATLRYKAKRRIRRWMKRLGLRS